MEVSELVTVKMFPTPLNLSLPGTSTQKPTALGFGDLCRHFYRALKDDFDDYTAHTVIDYYCWNILHQNFAACHSHDRVLEEKPVPVLRPGGDVLGQHAAQPGQGVVSQGA